MNLSHMKSHAESLAFRLLKWLTVIILIIVAILGAIWFFCLQFRTESERQQILHASLTHVDTIFSQYLNSAEMLATEIYNSPKGKRCRLEATELMDNMELLQDMSTSVSNNAFIHSIYILDKNDEVALHMSGGKRFTDEIGEALADQLSSQTGRKKPIFWVVKGRFQGEERIPLLSVYTREAGNGAPFYSGAVVVNIDLQWVAEELFAQTGELMEQFILDGDGKVILHSDGASYGQDFLERPEVRKLLEEKGDQPFLRRGNAFSEISVLQSSSGPFYIFAQSDSLEYLENIWGILRILIMTTLTLILGILVFVYIGNKNVLRPLNRIVDEIRSSDLLADGGAYEGNELAYLNHYHQSVTRYIKELKKEEEKNQLVKNLLLGNPVQPVLLEEGAVRRDAPYYLVLVYLPEDEEGAGSNLLRYDVKNREISRELTARLGALGTCTGYVASMRRLLFLLAEEQAEPAPEGLPLGIQTCVEGYFAPKGQPYILLAERAETGKQECVDLYKSVNSRLKTRLFLNSRSVSHAAEREGKAALERQIKQDLTKGDKAAYMKSVNQWMDGMQNAKWEDFTESMEQLLEDLTKKKVTQTRLTGEKQRQQIKEKAAALENRQELLKWFEIIYDETVYGIHEATTVNISRIVEKAVDHINLYYGDQDLNLNTLARKLNVSSSYFGKSFKDYTGCTMAEYLTKVRMEKARAMLLSEEKTDVAQIAQRAGYSSSAYFITVFKKYFGVPPSKFREYYILQNQQEETEC